MEEEEVGFLCYLQFCDLIPLDFFPIPLSTKDGTDWIVIFTGTRSSLRE